MDLEYPSARNRLVSSSGMPSVRSFLLGLRGVTHLENHNH